MDESGYPRLRVLALLVAIGLALGVAPADATTMKSAAFRPPVLTTRWTLDSGDCVSSISISNSRRVGVYGFFSGWHVGWWAGDCLATSNAKKFAVKAGTYYAQGHPLPPATYYVQVRYCHDSDFSGNYYCRASNVLGFRVGAPG